MAPDGYNWFGFFISNCRNCRLKSEMARLHPLRFTIRTLMLTVVLAALVSALCLYGPRAYAELDPFGRAMCTPLVLIFGPQLVMLVWARFRQRPSHIFSDQANPRLLSQPRQFG
jgi:hypothetical protein